MILDGLDKQDLNDLVSGNITWKLVEASRNYARKIGKNSGVVLEEMYKEAMWQLHCNREWAKAFQKDLRGSLGLKKGN